MLRKIIAFESVTSMLINQLANDKGFIGITPASEVDITASVGVISETTKCLWTKSGHIVEIWYEDELFITMTSPVVDLLKPLFK